MAEVKSLNEIKVELRRLHSAIGNEFSVKKIILYGSYAKGNPRPDSDVDIGVVLDAPPTGDKIDVGKRLFHHAALIDTAIEPLCIFWSDYINHEPASILGEIIRTGIEILPE